MAFNCIQDNKKNRDNLSLHVLFNTRFDGKFVHAACYISSRL